MLSGISIFILCAVLRLAVIDRQSLWTDEFFSLAMATGHSLEHAANQADALQGDYIESSGPIPSSQVSEVSQARSIASGSRPRDPCGAAQRYESAVLLPHRMGMDARLWHRRLGPAALVDSVRTRMLSLAVEAGQAIR